jgi:transposase
MAFTTGAGQPPRIRSIRALGTSLLLSEIDKAKLRFGLPNETPVLSCHEACRDGFQIHRFLMHTGVKSIVADCASIEVNRRKRRAKSDRLDAIRHHAVHRQSRGMARLQNSQTRSLVQVYSWP